MEPDPNADHKPADYSGIFVPRIVLEDDRLSNTERLLFGMVDGLDDPGRGCFGSNAYFCKRLGISHRAIQNALCKLESLGYITRGWGAGSRIIKTVTTEALEGVQKNAGGVQKTSRGGCRKMHPYRIGDRKDLDNPPTPLKGGNKESREIWFDGQYKGLEPLPRKKPTRRRAMKMNPEDYRRGF